MSQGIFPWRIRVPVFFLTRLYANAEIGVPRGELHVSGAASVPTVTSALRVTTVLPAIPAPPPVIPASPPVIPASPPVIPAKAGILIRVWTF